MMAQDSRTWVGDVLRFWFEELTPEDWWRKRPVVDETIARRFFALHDRLSQEAAPWSFVTAQSMLAAVIALDQFPRHLFRGDGRSFASDPLAMAIAARAVDGGFDWQLPPERRRFLYMPYEHSEDRFVQARSVELFASLGSAYAEQHHYAVLHKVIIDRFGRFPHRNAQLGRASTPEEVAFLAGPNSSF